MAEAPYFESFFELDGLPHGGRARGLGELHVLPVFLVEEVEIFRFFPVAHDEVFVHFGVFRPNLVALLVREVRDAPGVHPDCPLDRGLLFEVLPWTSNTCGTVFSLWFSSSELGPFVSPCLPALTPRGRPRFIL